MHWIGIVITLIAGLFGISLSRKYFQKKIPSLNDYIIDLMLIMILVIGILFTTFQYFSNNKQIHKLKDRTEILEFQDIANYNASGNKSGSIMGIPFVKTPIDDWNEAFLIRENGYPIWKCSIEAMKACEIVIAKLPNYPFSYYFLAICKQELNDPSWIKDAQKALSILEKTTSLINHHKDHDLIYIDVKALLEGNHVNN